MDGWGHRNWLTEQVREGNHVDLTINRCVVQPESTPSLPFPFCAPHNNAGVEEPAGAADWAQLLSSDSAPFFCESSSVLPTL